MLFGNEVLPAYGATEETAPAPAMMPTNDRCAFLLCLPMTAVLSCYDGLESL